MILADRPLSEIRYRAVTDGMITLRQSAVKKVLDGRDNASRDQPRDLQRRG